MTLDYWRRMARQPSPFLLLTRANHRLSRTPTRTPSLFACRLCTVACAAKRTIDRPCTLKQSL